VITQTLSVNNPN